MDYIQNKMLLRTVHICEDKSSVTRKNSSNSCIRCAYISTLSNQAKNRLILVTVAAQGTKVSTSRLLVHVILANNNALVFATLNELLAETKNIPKHSFRCSKLGHFHLHQLCMDGQLGSKIGQLTEQPLKPKHIKFLKRLAQEANVINYFTAVNYSVVK